MVAEGGSGDGREAEGPDKFRQSHTGRAISNELVQDKIKNKGHLIF